MPSRNRPNQADSVLLNICCFLWHVECVRSVGKKSAGRGRGRGQGCVTGAAAAWVVASAAARSHGLSGGLPRELGHHVVGGSLRQGRCTTQKAAQSAVLTTITPRCSPPRVPPRKRLRAIAMFADKRAESERGGAGKHLRIGNARRGLLWRPECTAAPGGARWLERRVARASTALLGVVAARICAEYYNIAGAQAWRNMMKILKCVMHGCSCGARLAHAHPRNFHETLKKSLKALPRDRPRAKGVSRPHLLYALSWPNGVPHIARRDGCYCCGPGERDASRGRASVQGDGGSFEWIPSAVSCGPTSKQTPKVR